eukprot:8815493-Ditylum_brightwellii.AAC.2
MSYPQPPTLLHADNSTAVGITNKTVKPQKSRAMSMQYFWLLDQVKLKNFDVSWHPGQENLADYPTKHHTGTHHQHVCPCYVHTTSSPRFLSCAPALHALQGCVNSPSKDIWMYDGRTPLPRKVSRTRDPRNDPLGLEPRNK